MNKHPYIQLASNVRVRADKYMKRIFWHKGWVWILSVVDTYAIWSQHKTEDADNKGQTWYCKIYQAEHNKQIVAAYDQYVKEEGLLLVQTIDDKTKIDSKNN